MKSFVVASVIASCVVSTSAQGIVATPDDKTFDAIQKVFQADLGTDSFMQLSCFSHCAFFLGADIAKVTNPTEFWQAVTGVAGSGASAKACGLVWGVGNFVGNPTEATSAVGFKQIGSTTLACESFGNAANECTLWAKAFCDKNKATPGSAFTFTYKLEAPAVASIVVPSDGTILRLAAVDQCSALCGGLAVPKIAADAGLKVAPGTAAGSGSASDTIAKVAPVAQAAIMPTVSAPTRFVVAGASTGSDGTTTVAPTTAKKSGAAVAFVSVGVTVLALAISSFLM